MLVHVLDGVLDGEDVDRTRLVDAVDDRRQGGGLSRAGRSGQEHQPRGRRASHSATGGRPELVEGRDVGRDHAEGKGDLTLLGVRAATQAGPVQPAEGEVHVLIVCEGGLLLRREHGPDDLLDLLAGEDRRVDRARSACRRLVPGAGSPSQATGPSPAGPRGPAAMERSHQCSRSSPVPLSRSFFLA